MRIRYYLLALPACAATGVATFSMVAAQEPTPVYYPSRTTPDIGQQQPPPRSGRTAPPIASGSGVPSAAVDKWAPVRNGAGPASLPPPSMIYAVPDQPAMKVVAPADSGVKPTAFNEPVIGPRVNGLFFPDAPMPKIDAPPVIPLTPVAPSTSPAPYLPPPRITVESNIAEPKPLPLTRPPLVPAASGPQTLAPAAPPAMMPAMSAPNPMATAFPTTPLTSKHAPAITLEAIAPEAIGLGQNVDYALVVRNGGATAVTGVRVEDELPAGTKLVSCDPPGEQTGDRMSWLLGTLDAGMEKRIKISVKPADEGEVRSRAMVTFSAAAEARVKVTRPRIGVAVSSADNARVGDEVPFQIRITNTGTGPAAKLMIQAKLSDGLNHPAGGVIEAEVANLSAGETKTITLRAIATKAGAHACSIVASVAGNTPETARAAVAVVEPLLQAKLVGPARCFVRTEPEFKIELANPGTAATDPVQVWAVIPEGFEVLQTSDNGTFNATNRTVTWATGSLPINGTRTLGMKLRATAASDGTVRVVAQAAPPAAEGEVVAAGARAATARLLETRSELAVKAEGVPALRFEVVAIDNPVEVGKEAVYEIRLVNGGTGPCTNVQVTATMADGTVAAGANGPTAARGQGQTIAFDPIGTVAMKGETTFRVKVRGTQAGDYRIRVQVACDQMKSPVAKEENTRFYKD